MRLPPPALPPFTISPHPKLPSATRIQPRFPLILCCSISPATRSSWAATSAPKSSFREILEAPPAPFTSLGAITGQGLGHLEHRRDLAVFRYPPHAEPALRRQHWEPGSVSDTALNISNATVAAFSPDSLKAYIVGGVAGTSLYAYSPVQALKGPFPLTGPGKAIAFAPNGAFAFVAQANSGAGANLTAYNTCNNQVATDREQRRRQYRAARRSHSDESASQPAHRWQRFPGPPHS